MALLQKLKELLGIGGDERSGRRDTEVTVERDTESVRTPAAEPEADADADPEETAEAEAAEEPDETGETEQPDETAVTDESDDEGSPNEDGESVQNIKGIGPAYAERLEGIGITTVAQLADADAESVAEEAQVGEGRASTWIERANESR